MRTLQAACLDLVVAADTFIYVGELGKVFAAVARALKKEGFFIFSVEDLDRSSMRTAAATATATSEPHSSDPGRTVLDRQGASHVIMEDEVVGAVPGWGAQLLTSTRFAHSATYIDLISLVHRFRLVTCRSTILRSEGSRPVYGLMYVLQRIYKDV